MKLKNLIKFLILVVATMLGETSVSAGTLSKAMVAEGYQEGVEISPASFEYILRNKNKMKRNAWNTIPTTGQKIFICADLNDWGNNVSSTEIAEGLISLDASHVKRGLYGNNGYSKVNGAKVPLYDELGPIIAGYRYTCSRDSVAKFKGNCGNEIDYRPIITYKPATPEPEPVMEKKVMMVMCLGEIQMGEKEYDGDIAIGQFSFSGNYYYRYRDKRWFKLENNQWVEACYTKPAVTHIIPKPILYKQTIPQPIAQNETNNANINVDNSVRNFNINVSPVLTAISMIAQARYSTPYYQPQPQRQYCQQPQRQYCLPQPQRQWTGSSFDGGQYYPQTGVNGFDGGNYGYTNTSNGTVFDGGQGYTNTSNGAGFDGSGRIPGIKEIVQ